MPNLKIHPLNLHRQITVKSVILFHYIPQIIRESRFSDIYSFKYNLQNSVTEIISRQRINNASGDSAALHQIAAPASGIVSYSYDNMESLTADDITDDLFNYSNYENHQLTSSERLEANAPAFRLTTNNVWSIVIKLSPEQAASLNETPERK